MSYSIIIWSIAIIALEEYLSNEDPAVSDSSKMLNNKPSVKMKKKNVNV